MNTSALPSCEICGLPLPKGEEAFRYHGFSGKCPVTPKVPSFLVWRCAGCGAPAEGKKKPCECATNVGTREGPNGKREQTWWEESPTIDWKANCERVQAHLQQAVAERDEARALIDGAQGYRKGMESMVAELQAQLTASEAARGRCDNALRKIKLCPEGAWTIAHEALAEPSAEG